MGDIEMTSRSAARGLRYQRNTAVCSWLRSLHQALKGGDALLYCRQLSRCSWISPPFRIASFQGVECVFNTSDQFDGIRLYQRRFIGFSPGMRYTSHLGPLQCQTTWTRAWLTLRARTEGNYR